MQDRRRGKIELIEKKCRFCGDTFYICRACYHGQVYCSDFCRRKGYRDNRRKARKKYRSSPKGKNKRRIEARLYRLNSWKKTQGTRKFSENLLKIKNQTALTIKTPRIYDSIPICRFCGSKGYVVKEFPRRPYGKKCLQGGSIYVSKPGSI